ncbi:hypothetical protein [Engelhardtia mirabilis]|uniref:HTH merR-type domain-containing protein n=1 Tax=Engelhardtia mirabilis TaxID=2528011 RepID=A0A518BME3_9BACT|nr:hypothetical protein Pla133_32450 [Planctomycetes bacterium Pla133]QDV02477.1 hypothetical protein Pla86_32440 [Planctomycetes bacterium Pla86]
MNREPILHEGERYLSLEVVAEIYQVRAVVLREVYERGLLGEGLTHDSTVCIATLALDRVATIVRLHEVHGLDPDAIAAHLGAD